MLSRAEGIVIVPELFKIGAVVSIRRGHGIAVIRDQNRVWQAPAFVTLEGAGLALRPVSNPPTWCWSSRLATASRT